jgi:uncharacterized protein
MRLKYVWLVPVLAIAGLGAAGREVPLIDAVKKGDVKAVRTVLAKGDVNVAQPDGTTALHWAAHREDLETVDLLLRAGANAKATNRYGVTPLSLAALKGNAAVIERLIKGGADANAPLPGSETPLMTAARTGKPDAVRVLLAHGADPNAREATRGQTALMWAAAEGNAAAAKALIEGGADVHARATGPASAAAAGRGRGPIRLDAVTPLLLAARRGHTETVKVLLAGGANIKEKAPDGSGPVTLAIANAHYDLASYLLDQGADPNAATEGWTALHQLVRTRRPSVARLNPPVGFDADSSLTLVTKLIAKGADVNARQTKEVNDGYRHNDTRLGATPFYLAAKGLDAKMMRLLLAQGADPRLSTVDGSTPLMAAAGYGDAAPNESGSDDDAVEAVKVALGALDAEAINAANKTGWTALHGAAYSGSNRIVELLIEKGAKLDPKIREGLTPLGVAKSWGDNQHTYEQPQTAKLLTELMTKRGMPVDGAANAGLRPIVAVPAPAAR